MLLLLPLRLFLDECIDQLAQNRELPTDCTTPVLLLAHAVGAMLVHQVDNQRADLCLSRERARVELIDRVTADPLERFAMVNCSLLVRRELAQIELLLIPDTRRGADDAASLVLYPETK